MLGKAALAALAASLGCLAGCGGREAAARLPAPATKVALEGVVWSEFSGARLARRVRAERLLVVPRRMGVLQVSPVSELVLTRPVIEVFAPEAEGGASPRGAGDPAPAAAVLAGRGSAALPSLGAARHIVAATLFEPTFTFLRGGAPVARLQATRASADARDPRLALHGVRLELVASGRRVTAERAVWLADAEALWIEGEYDLVEGGATRRGRGLRVDVAPRRDGAP